MMRRQVYFELALIARDRRALWSLIGLAILILLAFGGLSLQAARNDADKREVAAAERARWVGQGTKDPHSAAHYSIFAFKTAPALEALDPGAGPFVGQAIWLEAHHQNDMLHRPQQNASVMQRMGLASPAGLIFELGPLVAFLLAFTVIAQDREQGTMRLALGSARRPWRIIAAKVLAIETALVGALVLPVSLLTLILLTLQGRVEADVVLRLTLWASLGAFYLGVFAALGAVVALRASSARLALTALFSVWIVLALVLPRAAGGVAERLVPLPSSQEVRQQLLDAAPAYWTAEQAERNKQAILRRYGVARVEDVPNYRMAELDLMERHSHAVFDRVLGGFYDKVAAQDRVFAALGAVSPAIAAQSLSAGATGADFGHHRHFIGHAERYRRDLVNRMNGDGMSHAVQGTQRHTADARLWSQIPAFSYRPPRLGEVPDTTSMALAALLLWTVGALCALGLAARGLKP